ncbi:G-patch domain and KOW motifs-containing protein-like [Panonychus citri]|uniref:G-patch domain and KOW motifs-containing protein-like n=1 Tax=Panonychus citri TaxID=50023 RepID=UPI00230714B3|nr:G-patch domain and KOW motifs-containing protein-like [Panonychus citri]
MEKKISFSFKRKPDTRGFVKPKEEVKKTTEEYVTSIEGRRIESLGGGGGGEGSSSSQLVIPLTKGQKISDEPNNYDDIPVEGFGVAMLRGMGWTENDDQIKPIETYIRPKGAGLGSTLSRK